MIFVLGIPLPDVASALQTDFEMGSSLMKCEDSEAEPCPQGGLETLECFISIL